MDRCDPPGWLDEAASAETKVIPSVVLERVTTPIGEMTLTQHGGDFMIRVGKIELMNSRNHVSEDEFGRIGCDPIRELGAPRVLVGGLGLGYTLRACLDMLPASAHIDVAELVPEVVRWNRDVYGSLARHPLTDPRVHVIEEDVARVIGRAANPQGAKYDAILLDVDNGPDGVGQYNDALYRSTGVALARAALSTSGVLAVWSAFDSSTFTQWLHGAGFYVEIRRIHARGAIHFVWLARLAQPSRSFRDGGRASQPRPPRAGAGSDGRRSDRARGPAARGKPRPGSE
jgi:spermidine synthase